MTQCSQSLAVGCNVISVGTEATSRGVSTLLLGVAFCSSGPRLASGVWPSPVLLECCSCDFTACALRPLLHTAHKVAHPVYSVSLCLTIRGDWLALCLVVVSGIKFVHKVLCESWTVKVEQIQNICAPVWERSQSWEELDWLWSLWMLNRGKSGVWGCGGVEDGLRIAGPHLEASQLV